MEDLSRRAIDQLQAHQAAAIQANNHREPLGTVGRYVIQSILGEGGLGTVYGAWDPVLSRKVAVKTLQGRWLNDSTLGSPNELILNEARAAARLSHANIVTVYDAGASDQGVYIAMEPLQGQDIRHLLRGGWQPSLLEIASILRKVAEALAYAHGKGVVHCDIKPANIFMVDKRSPKVLDFGIARVSRKDGAVTHTAAAGSPHYLSPEQIHGGEVDRRCDVYSLGVVMYELMTHQLPYTGSTVDEITGAVLNEPQPQAHQIDARIPPGLSAIAAKAMARDPDQRYPSARHFALALQEWTQSEEAGNVKAIAQRRVSAVRVATLVALVASAIGATALWQTQMAGRLTARNAPVAASAPAVVEASSAPASAPAAAASDPEASASAAAATAAADAASAAASEAASLPSSAASSATSSSAPGEPGAASRPY